MWSTVWSPMKWVMEFWQSLPKYKQAALDLFTVARITFVNFIYSIVECSISAPLKKLRVPFIKSEISHYKPAIYYITIIK